MGWVLCLILWFFNLNFARTALKRINRFQILWARTRLLIWFTPFMPRICPFICSWKSRKSLRCPMFYRCLCSLLSTRKCILACPKQPKILQSGLALYYLHFISSHMKNLFYGSHVNYNLRQSWCLNNCILYVHPACPLLYFLTTALGTSCQSLITPYSIFP